MRGAAPLFMRRTHELVTLLALFFFASPASCAVSGVFSAKESGDPRQSANSQQASQQKQSSAPDEPSIVEAARASRAQEKTGKVWTNDEVVALRTPADIYLLEKEAREAAEAEAAEKAAQEKAAKEAAPKVASPAAELPATREDTQKLIDAKTSEINEDQATLDRYTSEVDNEPADRKEQMQGEITRITAELPKKKLELKTLQDHLEELMKAQPTAASAPPPQP
jgi:colicin import membrane protein